MLSLEGKPMHLKLNRCLKG